MKMKINPAILVDSLTEFASQIHNAEKFTNEVDVDIIDWERTPRKTITILDALSIETSLKLNFDLMLDYPTAAVDQLLLYSNKNVHRIIINLASKDEIMPLLQLIKKNGKQAGISLNPNHSLADAEAYLAVADLIQIYTVEPGSQGNAFLPDRLQLATELKIKNFKGKIEIDGGVKPENIELIKTFPLDYVSVGSTISRAEDPEAVYKNLVAQLAS